MPKSPLFTSITTGIMVGTATYMMTRHHYPPLRHHNVSRHLRRTTGQALKTVGNVMENISYMMS